MQIAEQAVDEPPTGSSGRVPLWAGALVGLVSLAAGLAVGDLIAALRDNGASRIVEVGNRVVDLTPTAVRKWAISTFGTSDKNVLITGVVVVLVLVSVLAGVWMVRDRRVPAVVMLGAVLVVGAGASLGRGGAGWYSAVATLVGGAVGVAVMWLLADRARAVAVPVDPVAPVDPAGGSGTTDVRPVPMGGASRRGFLGLTAGVGVAAVAAGGLSSWLRSQAAVAAERLGVTLPTALKPLPPVSPAVSVGVPGVSPFITPTDDFYRIDTALVPPKVSTDGWTVKVHGRVQQEVSLTYRELLARPMIELDATIACVSNEVGGDLVGTARWLGCRLDDLLDEAGIDPGADQVVGRSVDGFTAGFPTSVLDGRDAIVAVGMNGEALTTEHGYPARLIVPGLYGYVSATKWLSDIEVTRFDEFEGYWVPRGWNDKGPIIAESRIDTPQQGATVPAGRSLAVAGVAWAPIQGIAGVEVQVGKGPWQPAQLGENHADTTWRQWKYAFTPAAGEHSIRVRATDNDGATQVGENTSPGPGPATGWHTVEVSAS